MLNTVFERGKKTVYSTKGFKLKFKNGVGKFREMSLKKISVTHSLKHRVKSVSLFI